MSLTIQTQGSYDVCNYTLIRYPDDVSAHALHAKLDNSHAVEAFRTMTGIAAF